MNKYISFAHVDLVSKSLTPDRFQLEQTQVFTGLFRASFLTQRYTIIAVLSSITEIA